MIKQKDVKENNIKAKKRQNQEYHQRLRKDKKGTGVNSEEKTKSQQYHKSGVHGRGKGPTGGRSNA